ncbi:hypothetical protein SAMN05421827_11619 [Pedobacter terrae]|uniref:Uncharacterized protein n=1 Tax=Pedobacter terrae TaxID=405671 RepID=A0A1G7ZFJ4_9SPHI|nr:hypothetical protein SAMN05421827_11619 [Pedobacter terrae]
MKNSNKLFEKQIVLKNSQISGGRTSETYKNTSSTHTENGCTFVHSEVRNDRNQRVDECTFMNCPKLFN